MKLREIPAHGVGVNGTGLYAAIVEDTSDPKKYLAEELARDHAVHWEHELYYRELKLEVRNARVLASQTPERQRCTKLQLWSWASASASGRRYRTESTRHSA